MGFIRRLSKKYNPVGIMFR